MYVHISWIFLSILESRCGDRKKNKGETDIDCGGRKCGKCADRKKCKVDSDCISGSCKKERCAGKYRIFVNLNITSSFFLNGELLCKPSPTSSEIVQIAMGEDSEALGLY